MTAPIVHSNGTSKESLIRDLSTAYDALETAYQALKQTAPNGRDHYLSGPDAILNATAEHHWRLHRIDRVKIEVEELIQAIDAQ